MSKSKPFILRANETYNVKEDEFRRKQIIRELTEDEVELISGGDGPPGPPAPPDSEPDCTPDWDPDSGGDMDCATQDPGGGV